METDSMGKDRNYSGFSNYDVAERRVEESWCRLAYWRLTSSIYSYIYRTVYFAKEPYSASMFNSSSLRCCKVMNSS